MEKLREYLQMMEFKRRTVGGLDEENVLIHIKKICDLAREEMEEQGRAFEAATRKMQGNLDELKDQLARYRTAYQKLQDVNEKMDARMRELEKEANQYGKAKERAEQEQKKYRAKHLELMAAVDTLHSVTANAEKAARKEMSAALRAEEERARSRIQAEIERERDAARQEINKLHKDIAYLTRKRETMKDSLLKECEQWKRHLDWLAGRLEPREESSARMWPPAGDLKVDEVDEFDAPPLRDIDYDENDDITRQSDTEEEFTEDLIREVR